MESRRILGSRAFLAALAGLIAVNCFFFLYLRPDTWEDPLADGQVYHAQLEALSDLSWEDALAWCVRYQEDAQAAMINGTWDRQGEAEELRIVAAQLQVQYEHLLSYGAYLDKVESNAKLLQSVSLFADPNSISYRNTVKTALDFSAMQGKPITAGHDLAVTEFFADKWSDYSILILICLVCGLFLAERKEGLWPMIHAAPGGRWRLAVRRIGTLWTAAWIGTVMLVGSRVLLCGTVYHGLGEWGRTLQSIPMFQNVPTPVTVGGFWLLYITVKATGAFFFGLVLWAMLAAISNISLAIAAAGIVIGVEFACAAIPSSSMFAILRYVNIFSYVDFAAVFTRYLNLSVFGTLISGSDLVLVMLPPLCLVFMALVAGISHRKYPVAPVNRLLRWVDGFRRKTDPFLAGGSEAGKLLIKRRGILLLLLLVLVVHRMEAPPRRFVEWDPFIQFYQEQYAGPITQDKLAQMEQALEACTDPYNREGLRIVLADAETAPEGAWIVPTAPYHAIWSDNEENYHRTTALTALLFLVLILAPIASQEQQNSMTVLLRSTRVGRKGLMMRKQCLLLLITATVWLLVYGAELNRTVAEQGVFACLDAPAFSLKMFSKLPLPLGWTMGLYYLAKLLVMAAAGEVCFFLSSLCTKNRNAILLCCGVILIPAALAVMDSPIGKCLSFLLPLGGVELFRP